MKLPFGRKKADGHDHDHDHDHAHVKEAKPTLADIQVPEDATTVIVVGLDSKINPFIRSVGPVSPAQLALVNSYMTGLVMAQWRDLLDRQSPTASPEE